MVLSIVRANMLRFSDRQSPDEARANERLGTFSLSQSNTLSNAISELGPLPCMQHCLLFSSALGDIFSAA